MIDIGNDCCCVQMIVSWTV